MKKKILLGAVVSIGLVLTYLFWKSDSPLPEPTDPVAKPGQQHFEKSEISVHKTPATNVPSKLVDELKVAESELATLDDIGSLDPEEVHHTPDIVLEGGALLGRLQEKAESNPERRQVTLEFFLQCAENDEIIDSLRAVCWHKTLSLIPKWDLFVPVADAKVPESVQALAGQL